MDEKADFRESLLQHRTVFSLYTEIGDCPNIKVDFDLTDQIPFYIRPFTVLNNEKVVIDKELRHLELLGVLAKGSSDYTCPVMLVNRNGPNNRKRVVSDMRFLNS